MEILNEVFGERQFITLEQLIFVLKFLVTSAKKTLYKRSSNCLQIFWCNYVNFLTRIIQLI